MEELEEDVTKRLVLEPEFDNISKELDTLIKVNEQWPQNKMRIKQLEEEIKSIDKEIEELSLEKEEAKLLAEKNSLIEVLKKIENLLEDIEVIKGQALKINPITKEDIDLLQYTFNEMTKTEQ